MYSRSELMTVWLLALISAVLIAIVYFLIPSTVHAGCWGCLSDEREAEYAAQHAKNQASIDESLAQLDRVQKEQQALNNASEMSQQTQALEAMRDSLQRQRQRQRQPSPSYDITPQFLPIVPHPQFCQNIQVSPYGNWVRVCQ